MDPTLRELVCDNLWAHPDWSGMSIKFNQDGTGELRAVGEMGLGLLFTTTLQWKFISSMSTTDIINDKCFSQIKHTNMLTKRPNLLGCFRLEIQLDPTGPEKPVWRMGPDRMRQHNNEFFFEAAFQPRQFAIVIEQGNFGAGREGRHALRMTFDASPSPLREAYKRDRTRGPDVDSFYDWLSVASFYNGKVSDDLKQVRATDDDTVMGYHTFHCVMS